MPSTGNSHLVVFERTAEGDEHALDPGWWLKQQVRSDWNRIKLDTFIPIHLTEPAPKAAKKKADANKSTETEADQVAARPAKKTQPTNKKPKTSKPPKAAASTTPEQATDAQAETPATSKAIDAATEEPSAIEQEWADVAR